MAIDLQNGTNGLFDVLGKFFFDLDTLNIARLTTVHDVVQNSIDTYKLVTGETIDSDPLLGNVAAQQTAWEASAVNAQGFRQICVGYLIKVTDDDSPLPIKDEENALLHLITDILDQAHFVDANVIGLTVAADAGNTGTDLVIVSSNLRFDGRVQEHAIPEVISIEVTDVAGPTIPSVRFLGEQLVADRLSHLWPAGSGVGRTLSATDSADSLVANGDWEDEEPNQANLPTGWVLNVGVVGTDIVVTDPEIQTIIIAGTPTTGGYVLKWVNPDGVERTTAFLAFNAGGNDVQTALQAITGLELVTVVATGTSPNFTHTITFDGVAGNINQLTAVSYLDVGTITPATPTPGDDNSYIGKALGLVGDAATLTELVTPLTLAPETVFCCHFFHKKTGTPVAGTVRIAIVEEIAGSVTTDPEDNSNSAVFDLTAVLTTSFATGSFFFRLRKTQTQPVYLQIIQTVAISAGTSYYIDHVSVVQATELYPGGPFVSVFSGATPPIVGDKFTLTVTNDGGGELQTQFQKFYGMAERRLLLPSVDPGGGTLIPDSVIS